MATGREERAWGTGERLGAQEWQTGERIGAQDWQSAENVLDRTFTTSEREAVQDWQTAERMGAQDWESAENLLGRTFSTEEREAAQSFVSAEAGLDRSQQASESRLGRELTTTEAALDRTLTQQGWTRQESESALDRLLTESGWDFQAGENVLDRMLTREGRVGEYMMQREGWTRQASENALDRTLTRLQSNADRALTREGNAQSIYQQELDRAMTDLLLAEDIRQFGVTSRQATKEWSADQAYRRDVLGDTQAATQEDIRRWEIEQGLGDDVSQTHQQTMDYLREARLSEGEDSIVNEMLKTISAGDLSELQQTMFLAGRTTLSDENVLWAMGTLADDSEKGLLWREMMNNLMGSVSAPGNQANAEVLMDDVAGGGPGMPGAGFDTGRVPGGLEADYGAQAGTWDLATSGPNQGMWVNSVTGQARSSPQGNVDWGGVGGGVVDALQGNFLGIPWGNPFGGGGVGEWVFQTSGPNKGFRVNTVTGEVKP